IIIAARKPNEILVHRISHCTEGSMWIRAIAVPAVLTTLTVFGQEFRATVAGSVTDAQGGAVPGAVVEVRNLDTNVVVSTRSNDSGSYAAPFVPPGRYAVTVSRDGFKRAVRDSVELRVGDRLRLDFQLDVGA